MNKHLLELSIDDYIDYERIERLRAVYEKRVASIDAQRALIYTDSFKKSEGEPYILRKAKAFADTLNHMDLYFETDSLIFGNQAARNFAAPIFPEYSIDWVIEELDTFDQRDGDVFQIDENTKAQLRAIAPYWHGHTHEDAVKAELSDAIKIATKQGVLHLGGISMSGDGHIVPNHELILNQGLIPIKQQAQQALHKAVNKEQIDYYQAVIICIDAVLVWIKRYEALARDLAKQSEPQRADELNTIAKMCEHLLQGKAQNFYEAVESVYLIHVLQMIESNGHSFCYGRYDQYLYPFYQTDIENKTITQGEALTLITHMFIMNSSLNKVRPYAHTRFSQGYPLYSNLMIGGYTPDGTDGSNALSYLCIEAMHLTSLAEPNFSMRYNKQTPPDLIRLAAKLIRSGCGMPSMFNDEVAVKGLEDLGISHEDALDYCAIGCVETGVPGKYGHRATGMTYVNWGKLVEMLIYNGYDPKTHTRLVKINDTNEAAINYQSFEEVQAGWVKLLTYYSDLAVESDNICDKYLEIYDCDPFASCLVDNSMKLGKTLKTGGCKYDVISQSNIGPSVVGNSLEVIKELIFKQQLLSFDELRDAMQANWQGAANAVIQALVKNVAKFGNDNDEVDAMVKWVFDCYLDLLPKYQTRRFGRGPLVSCYTMSTSNITSYVPNGQDVGATPDGREAGSPLNEGCSPTQGTDINGPTALINSVAKLPNSRVAAGQLLNMRFAPDALAGEENLAKFVAFLQAGITKGIYHNQFNVMDSATLRAAQIHPEQYRNLIVRVAGYCAQFVSLMPAAQEAIIARSENCFN